MQQSRERKIDVFTCSAVNASGALLNCTLLNLPVDETKTIRKQYAMWPAGQDR